MQFAYAEMFIRFFMGKFDSLARIPIAIGSGNPFGALELVESREKIVYGQFG